MKKWITIGFFFLLSASLLSQEKFSISGKATSQISPAKGATVETGKKVLIKEFNRSIRNVLATKFVFYADCDGIEVQLEPRDLKNIDYDIPTTNDQNWQIIKVKSDLYENLASKGFQYDLRRDLEDDTIDLISNFQRYYGLFNDDYLDDYIQGLLYKIHPVTLSDERPGNLVVRVLQHSYPNAFSTATGTIIITTGLLSICRSEDELLGVLAHEVAHYVLDHQIVNINKASERQKRAEFWATLATTMAAASEIYLNAKKEINTGGGITLATAVLSTSIADSISERLGAKYSQSQEGEADIAAIRWLEFMKKDPKVLSATLSRIRNYCILNGDYLALSGSGSHPTLDSRIRAIGIVDPNKYISPKYDRTISFVNTYNAVNEFALKHLEAALQLANRNIESGVATEEDYLLKGIVIRTMYDTVETNQEALNLIQKAKAISVMLEYYPEIYKQEGITLLRLGKVDDAINSFQLYLQKLEGIKDKPQYIIDEIIWAKKMIYKIKLKTPSF